MQVWLRRSPEIGVRGPKFAMVFDSSSGGQCAVPDRHNCRSVSGVPNARFHMSIDFPEVGRTTPKGSADRNVWYVRTTVGSFEAHTGDGEVDRLPDAIFDNVHVEIGIADPDATPFGN